MSYFFHKHLMDLTRTCVVFCCQWLSHFFHMFLPFTQMHHQAFLAFFRWKDYDQILEAPLRVFDWRPMIWCAHQPWEGTDLPPIMMEDHGSVKNGMCPTGLKIQFIETTEPWVIRGESDFCNHLWESLFVGDVCQQGVVETPVRCSQDSVRKKKNPSQRKEVTRHHPPEIRE